ncbi:MAG: hypothetical protein ACPL1Y_03750 [Thermoplasmata archaeon]
MQIEIRKEYTRNELEKLIKDFAEKHETIEKLQQSILVAKCTKPFAVDDYFIWDAINRGAKFTESTYITYPDVFNILTPRRVELLEYLHNKLPMSILQIARELNRNYKNVYDDISALEEAELIITKKRGRNVYITSVVSSIVITFQKT